MTSAGPSQDDFNFLEQSARASEKERSEESASLSYGRLNLGGSTLCKGGFNSLTI